MEIDKPLSQSESYKVARWLRRNGKNVEAVLIEIWRKRPSEVAKEYQVDQKDILKAANRKMEYI